MTAQIPLSKKTEHLRNDVRGLKAELAKLTPQIAAGVESDTKDIDPLSQKIGVLRAKKDIIENRLAKRRDELFGSFLADARESYAAAEAEVIRARDEWRTEREHWRQAVKECHAREPAERILNDKQLQPKALMVAQRTQDEARALVADVSLVLSAIDNEYRGKTVGTATSQTGEPRIFSEERIMKNAAQFIPELGG